LDAKIALDSLFFLNLCSCCFEDTKLCSDGTVLNRDPSDNCNFPECFPIFHDEVAEENLCPQDIKFCLNGELVMRDPDNNCDFFSCEEVNSLELGGCNTTEEILCDDMITKVYRNITNNCEFDLCPEPEDNFVECNTTDEILCDDMVTKVYRNITKNCQFDLCPETIDNEILFIHDIIKYCDQSSIQKCSNGNVIYPDPAKNCTITSSCIEENIYGFNNTSSTPERSTDFIECSSDIKMCPDGSWLTREIKFGCGFPACKDLK